MLSNYLEQFAFPLARISQQGIVQASNDRWNLITGMGIGTSIFGSEALGFGKSLNELSLGPNFEIEVSLNPLPGRMISEPFAFFLSRYCSEQSDSFLIRASSGLLTEGQYSNRVRDERLKEMGEMAAGISHEITNPLTVIAAKAAMAEFLLEDPSNIDRVKAAIKSISNQCDRITKIVRSMRTFSREGSADPFVETSLPEMVGEAMALCSEKIRMAGVLFDVMPAEKPLMISCRSFQIVQIFVNIFNNAIDAVQNWPEPKVKVRYEITNEFIEIRVTDNGVGVPAAVAERLFQPFYTTKEVGKGTGLGLSVSLRLAKENHGDLFLDSSQAGSCFVLRFPRLAGSHSFPNRKAQ